MAVLYVTEQGARVNRKSERLLISKAGVLLRQEPLAKVEQLVLLGSVQITNAALRVCLRRGIDVALLTMGGKFLGSLTSGASPHVTLRRDQFRLLDDEARALALARRFVAGKIANQRALLGRYQRSRQSESLARALVFLRLTGERLAGCRTVDEVRGFEGRASAAYFEVFGELIDAPDMAFHTRQRRPPPDPVNVLLSFGYTMLTNAMHGVVALAGLDPHFGALHALERGRASLVLDLIEELRPVIVDTTVLRAINTRMITRRDFEDALESDEDEEEDELPELLAEVVREPDAEADGVADGGGGSGGEPAGTGGDARGTGPRPQRRQVIFTPAGVRKWVSAVEQRMLVRAVYSPRDESLTYRQIMREQVYRLARHVRGEDEYEPYEWRW
ncbi:MAG: CRISPR-associated endonuclease Cas1 [Candidatus Schekmanbacteria bacterium]|nr:CRISPR-associated endonuclease Cas1 [Candidatus Schekmanbacteria bacterium]